MLLTGISEMNLWIGKKMLNLRFSVNILRGKYIDSSSLHSIRWKEVKFPSIYFRNVKSLLDDSFWIFRFSISASNSKDVKYEDTKVLLFM